MTSVIDSPSSPGLNTGISVLIQAIAIISIVIIGAIVTLLIFRKGSKRMRVIKVVSPYIMIIIIGLILVNVYLIAPTLQGYILNNPEIIFQFIPAKIESTNPSNEASNVPLDRALSVSFNIPINISSIYPNTIKLADVYSDNTVNVTVSYDNSNQEPSEDIKIEPVVRLEPFTRYKVQVDTSIKDISGKNITTGKTWSFMTGTGLKGPEDRVCSRLYYTNSSDSTIKWWYTNIDKEHPSACYLNTVSEERSIHSINKTNIPSRVLGSLNPEKFYGSNSNDTIYGLGGDDIIYGGDGNDSLAGGSGEDYISGRNGDDFIYAGDHDNNHNTSYKNTVDVIYAGRGDDLVVSDGHDFIDCGPGNDIVKNRTNIRNSTILNCE